MICTKQITICLGSRVRFQLVMLCFLLNTETLSRNICRRVWTRPLRTKLFDGFITRFLNSLIIHFCPPVYQHIKLFPCQFLLVKHSCRICPKQEDLSFSCLLPMARVPAGKHNASGDNGCRDNIKAKLLFALLVAGSLAQMHRRPYIS